jgi:hypothetical protein
MSAPERNEIVAAERPITVLRRAELAAMAPAMKLKSFEA